MNVVPGSSFFQTVPGSAARPEAAQPGHATGRVLEAQAVDGDRRTARPDRPPDHADAPHRAPGAPYGPRGHLIDIVA